MSRYRDTAMFVGLSLCWAGSFVAIEVGLTAYPPVLFAGLRFDVATLVALPYVLAHGNHPESRRDLLAVAAAATLIVMGNAVLLVLGQLHTTSGIAAVVYALNPIMTAAFAAVLIGGERLDVLGAAGVLLGVVGVAFVARPDPAALASSATTLGVAFVTAAVAVVALGSVLIRRLDPDCSSLTLTAWAMGVGAVLIHAVSLSLGESTAVGAVGVSPLAAVVFLGVFASAVAYVLYFSLIDSRGPFEANLVSYVVPPLATLLGWLLLSEPLYATTGIGFVLILIGFLLVKREAVRDELVARGLAAPAGERP